MLRRLRETLDRVRAGMNELNVWNVAFTLLVLVALYVLVRYSLV